MATEPTESPSTDTDVINTNGAAIADAPEAEAADEPEAQVAEPEKAAEPEPEKPKQKSWEQRRIDELTRKRRDEERSRVAAEERASRLEAELAAARGGDAPKPAETSEETIRTRIRAEMEAEQRGKAFSDATKRVADEGRKSFGEDFDRVRADMTDTFGSELAARPDFFEALVELPDAHRVFYELGQNPERLDQVLRMSPTRMAIELTRMNDAKPAATKQVSKAPPPIDPVGNGGPKGSGELDDPDMPDDQWSAKFLRAMQKKGVLR